MKALSALEAEKITNLRFADDIDGLAREEEIQNHAAKVVFRKRKHEHVTPLLKKKKKNFTGSQ